LKYLAEHFVEAGGFSVVEDKSLFGSHEFLVFEF
jgi:hypothetical protein